MKRARRRWFRISLRSLFVIVLLLGTTLGWIGAKRTQSQRQRKVVMAIVELDGTPQNGPTSRRGVAYWLDESASPSRVVIRYDSGPFGRRIQKTHYPAWLLALTQEEWLHRVVAVDLAFTDATDAALAPLQILCDTESINLDGTSVTDEVVNHLSSMLGLRHLCLGETKVLDEGVRKLHKFQCLETLELWHNDITDAGIDRLRTLKNLKLLNVCGTQVTDDGIRQLQLSLPYCHIYWDGNETFRAINGSPTTDFRDQNNPASLVRAVNHLRSLGRQQALEALRQYVHVAPDSRRPAAGTYDQQRLCLILPLLFERLDSTQGIPLAPRQGNGSRSDWPVFRLEIVGDLPFHVGPGGFFQSRSPPPGRLYLVDWVSQNCRLRSRPLRPTDDPFAAADALLDVIYAKSSYRRFERMYRQHVREQVHAMVDDVVFENIERADLPWSVEWQEYLLDQVKLRWSDERQDYVLAE